MLDDMHLARRIHEIPLAEFLGRARVSHHICMADDGYVYMPPRAVDMAGALRISDFSGGAVEMMDDYSLAPLRAPGGAAVLHDAGDGSGPEPVGFYSGSSLNVAYGHRGRGLGALLVLAAALRRGGLLQADDYTPGGHATHRAAHRLAVTWAAEAGLDIPAAVLEDYPSLSATRPRP